MEVKTYNGKFDDTSLIQTALPFVAVVREMNFEHSILSSLMLCAIDIADYQTITKWIMPLFKITIKLLKP